MFEKDAPAAEGPSSASATATSSGDTAPDSAVASRQMSSSSTGTSSRASSEIGPLPSGWGESAAPSPSVLNGDSGPSLPQGDPGPAPPSSVDNDTPSRRCRGCDAVVAGSGRISMKERTLYLDVRGLLRFL